VQAVRKVQSGRGEGVARQTSIRHRCDGITVDIAHGYWRSTPIHLLFIITSKNDIDMASKSLRSWIGLVEPNLRTVKDPKASAAVAASNLFTLFAGVADGDKVLEEIADTVKPLPTAEYTSGGLALATELGLNASKTDLALRAENDQKANKIVRLDADNVALVTEKQALESQLSSARSALASMQSNTQSNQVVADLQQKLNDTEQKFRTADARASAAQTRITELEAEVARLTARLNNKTTAEAEESAVNIAEQAVAEFESKALELGAIADESELQRGIVRTGTEEAASRTKLGQAATAVGDVAPGSKKRTELDQRVTNLRRRIDAAEQNVTTNNDRLATLQAASSSQSKLSSSSAPPMQSFLMPWSSVTGDDSKYDGLFTDGTGLTKETRVVLASKDGNAMAGLAFVVLDQAGGDMGAFINKQISGGKFFWLAVIALHRSARNFNAAASSAKVGKIISVSDDQIVQILDHFNANPPTLIRDATEKFNTIRTRVKQYASITDIKAPFTGVDNSIIRDLDIVNGVIHRLGVATDGAKSAETGDKRTAIDNYVTFTEKEIGQIESIKKSVGDVPKKRTFTPIGCDVCHDDSDPVAGSDSDDDPDIMQMNPVADAVDSDVRLAGAADISSSVSDGSMWARVAAPVQAPVDPVANVMSKFF
jgi:hypothetical protein